MLNSHELSQVFSTSFLQSLILILFCLFVTVVLPRLKTGLGTILSLGLLACYTFHISSLYPFPSLVHGDLIPLYILMVGYGVILAKRVWASKKQREKSLAEGSEADKTLGLFYQQQGMLDLAFEKFRPLVQDEAVQDMLYGLGLEYEKNNQVQKALVVYKLILGGDRSPEDLDLEIFYSEETGAVCSTGATGGRDPALSGKTGLTTIEGYAISRELDRTPTGVWYKARDIKTDKPVWIETINLSSFETDGVDDIRDRLIADNQRLCRLKHPNIAEVIDWGQDQDHGRVYRVREYVAGKGLDQSVKAGERLSIRQTLRSVGQMAEALDFAHTKEAFHLSVRPASAVKSEKNVKIIDFGIGWIPSVFEDSSNSLRDGHCYMSPEQIAGKKVDGRSDIFSLGIVLFELLTGQVPFAGKDMASVMLSITKEKHASLRSFNPKIPRVIDQVVDRALEKDLKKRYQKAGQMAEHLHMVADRIDELLARKRSEGP